MRFLPAVLIAIVITLSPVYSYSQSKLTDWKAYSSLANTQAAAKDSSGNIWIATSGGIYYYNPNTNDYHEFRNIGDLTSIDIRAIAYDSERNEIVAGSGDGFISVWDYSGKWQNFGDIFNHHLPSPEITDIQFYNGMIYISGGWGLIIFDPVKKITVETVVRFKDFDINTAANDMLIRNDSIWVATDAGIAVNSLKNLISDRNTWTTYGLPNGLPTKKVNSIAFWNDTLYALSDKKILKLVDTTFTKVYDDVALISIMSDSRYLYVSTKFNVRVDINTIIDLDVTQPANLNGCQIFPASDTAQVIYFYQSGGIGIYQNGVNVHFIPNSPLSNLVSDIAVSQDNSLWCTTGEGPIGQGFSHFLNGKWINYYLQKYPEIKSDAYNFVNIMDNGDILVSNYGKGLLIGKSTNNADFTFQMYDSSNSAFVGLDGNAFIVAGQAEIDRNGYIWCPNMGLNSNGPVLVGFDQNFNSFPIFTNLTNENRNFYNLAIDYNNTKWMGSFPEFGVGLMYFNDNNTPDNPDDDIQGLLSPAVYPNLLTNDCNSLVIDKTGVLWIGTKNGLSAIVNPSSALSSKPNFIIRTIKFLDDKYVNDVMVDALDNKWIATSSGVWELNSDATDVIQIINTTNSPLPTDDIKSIATNPATGEIFFATRSGLYSAKSMSVQPSENYNISCYPQPYDPIKDNELVIDGLAGTSEVRILTTSGTLVQSINTNSRKVSWDGLDKNGTPVTNGVYLIVTVSADTKTSSVQKIAVVRK